MVRLPFRAYIAYAHDVFMAAVSFVLALYLRLGDQILYYSQSLLLEGTILFTAVSAVVFWFMGLYRGVWLYASVNDLLAIARATSVAILAFLLIMFLWTRLETLPRSLLVIDWFVLLALLGGPRFLYRWFKDRRIDLRIQGQGVDRVPVLLAGSGDGAELFIRHLARTANAPYRVAGILTERAARVGRQIHGVSVLGTLDQLGAVVDGLSPSHDRPQRVILTKDDLDGAVVRQLLDAADACGMTLARLPKLTALKSGIADGLEIRPVAVEDLLGRPQTAFDRDAMRGLIAGRRVLITGAGGSIGSELVRQVAEHGPVELALLDSSEHNLYSIDLEMAERHPALPRHALLADVRDRGRLDRIVRAHKPDLLFHAAALKHVPLVEANVFEAVATNVAGTVNVADACVRHGVGVMVMISTDKAVNPTSIMGATKRIAESYCQILDVGGGNGGQTRFVTVRFGNVLGSRGSVVPLFERQLAAGGPLTVTHPDMKRYFMTVAEAVALVLQTSALGAESAGGAESSGKIYVLDMGEPVSIMHLARQMIRLAGFQPDAEIPIEIVGPRPGEKLSEETFHGGEPLVPTACQGILLAAPRAADAEALAAGLRELADACGREDRQQVMALIHRLVPEYRPADWSLAATSG